MRVTVTPDQIRTAFEAVKDDPSFDESRGLWERGQPPVDRAAIVAALRRLSDLMLREPAIDSVDLNPVFGYPDGILAVDARIVLAPRG